MAPLKPLNVRVASSPSVSYPWLRGHGSIEALMIGESAARNIPVSMAERSWLH